MDGIKNLKVYLPEDGFGIRLLVYKDLIPNYIFKIGDETTLGEIIKIYSFYSFRDFKFKLGYKSELIKKLFLEYRYYFLGIKRDFISVLVNMFNKYYLDCKDGIKDLYFNYIVRIEKRKLTFFVLFRKKLIK